MKDIELESWEHFLNSQMLKSERLLCWYFTSCKFLLSWLLRRTEQSCLKI